jgi:cadmium resistance transport/sequestration family protein
MTELITAIATGLMAFTATNIDDIIMLLLFFSQINADFRKQHIVAGQYLGFGVLVLVSLPGFLGGLVFPRPWIGMLGMIPIAIGISRLLNREDDADDAVEIVEPEQLQDTLLSNVLSPQTYSVAAITFANGGDNIGIYVPLFASNSLQELIVILGTFFLLIGVWCYTAYRLTSLPAIADTLTRYGNQLVPFMLIGLGILILINSHTLEDRGLTTLTLILCCFCLLSFNQPRS